MQHRLPLRRRARCAFTLLELAISIGVIGILLGSSLVVVSQKTGQTQLEVSEEHLDDIVTALTRFEIRKGYLPCPASLTELPTAAEFGRQVNAGDCTYTVAPAGTTRIETSVGSGDWILTGAVPIYDLSFPDDFMADNFSNRYSYSVMQSLTKASTFENGAGAIVLKDSAGNDVITDGAFVVLSHGSDGKGAYRFESGALKSACGASANLDVENCNADAAFRKAPFNDGQEAATYFDDLVRWRSKQHFAEPVAVASPSPSPIVYGTPPVTYAFRLDGSSTSQTAGWSVAIGDINGDGFGDAIIGSRYYYSGGPTGGVHVVFGSATGINAAPASLSTLNGTNGFMLVGTNSVYQDQHGYAVASGDVNNDGFDDVILSAPYADNNGNAGGSVYVVFGKASGWASSIDLSSLNGTTGFRLDGDSGDWLGYALASGDVNNDNFDDIIMGWSGTGTAIVFGKASWSSTAVISSVLDGTDGTQIDTLVPGDAVAAGDVNGDGVDDILTTYVQSDYAGGGGGVDSGSVYVVFGRTSGWTATIDVSALNGTTGFRLDGEVVASHTGKSIASGDVNNDGYADIIIGSWRTNYTDTFAGSTYVVFGKASGWAGSAFLNSFMNGTAGFRIDGAAASDFLGYAAASGDFNGDGFDDIVTGSFYTDIVGSDSGSAYIIFGKASGWGSTLNVSTLNGTNGFRLDGSSSGDSAGAALAFGDLTGDYYADILIGANSASYNSLTSSGSVWGVYGRPVEEALDAVNDLNTLAGIIPAPDFSGFRANGATSQYAGLAVSTGDVNGDNIDDVIIGSTTANAGKGYVWVIFGTPTGISTPFALTGLNGTNGFRLDNPTTDMNRFGGKITSGDVNGDGIDDVIIGHSSANSNAGYTYVVFGKSSGWAAAGVISLDGTNGFRIDGIAAEDKTGLSVASGDLNNDGFDDVLIGSEIAGTSNTHTYAVFGKASGWAATMSLSTIDGTNGFVMVAPWLQTSVTSADINGDGFDDAVIGVPYYGGSIGRAYVVLGKANGWSASITLNSLNGSDGFWWEGYSTSPPYTYAAWTVAGGDINGDGFDDLVVGAYYANSNTGYTYVAFGKASGWSAANALTSLNGTTGFRLDGVATGDYVSWSLASGDINGDGFDDVIIGAMGADFAASASGSTYIVFGKASGWAATRSLSTVGSTTPGFRLDGSTASDQTGTSVSSGDITGDGISDIITSSSLPDYAASNSGATYGIYGRSSGTWDATYDLNTITVP